MCAVLVVTHFCPTFNDKFEVMEEFTNPTLTHTYIIYFDSFIELKRCLPTLLPSLASLVQPLRWCSLVRQGF
jgi:hypothetical protein